MIIGLIIFWTMLCVYLFGDNIKGKGVTWGICSPIEAHGIMLVSVSSFYLFPLWIIFFIYRYIQTKKYNKTYVECFLKG